MIKDKFIYTECDGQILINALIVNYIFILYKLQY